MKTPLNASLAGTKSQRLLIIKLKTAIILNADTMFSGVSFTFKAIYVLVLVC